MLKSILLASAVMIAGPALAQEAPPQDTTPPAQEQTAPPAEAPAPAPAPEPAPQDEATTDAAAPEQPAPESTPTPAPNPTPSEPDQTAAQEAAPAQQSATQPATPAQIAQIVDQGFPTYDKDADGDLKAEEFGQWMVALRSATEPAFTGESAADKEWIGKALTMADTDKSGTINKDELKGFLAPQPS